MTKYRFSEGAAIVFGGSGGLGTGIVNLLAESGSDVAFSFHKNKVSKIIDMNDYSISTLEVKLKTLSNKNNKFIKRTKFYSLTK